MAGKRAVVRKIPGNYVDDFGRIWKGPFGFSRDEVIAHIHDKVTGVYQILYMANGTEMVAYIGIATESNHLRKRLLEHVRDSSNWALARTQNPLAYQIIVYPCDSQTAHEIEAYVIEHRKPPFNVRKEYRHLVPGLSIAVH